MKKKPAAKKAPQKAPRPKKAAEPKNMAWILADHESRLQKLEARVEANDPFAAVKAPPAAPEPEQWLRTGEYAPVEEKES